MTFGMFCLLQTDIGSKESYRTVAAEELSVGKQPIRQRYSHDAICYFTARIKYPKSITHINLPNTCLVR